MMAQIKRCTAKDIIAAGAFYDRVVGLVEDIGYDISEMLKEMGFIEHINPYLEADVDTILGKR